MLIVGLLFASSFSSRNRSRKLHDRFGTEFDPTVQTMDYEQKAQMELNERQKYVADLYIRPLSTADRERFLADWTAVQSNFVDEPGQAIGDADNLVKEVMQIRALPVSNFDQRAADLSVSYPALVSNYRAAREVAIKNEQHLANIEELRQALFHYQSLFEELLGTEADAVKENI
jgi:hypothetical protein